MVEAPPKRERAPTGGLPRDTVGHEVWNRLRTIVLRKLRSSNDLTVDIEFSVSVSSMVAQQVG